MTSIKIDQLNTLLHRVIDFIKYCKREPRYSKVDTTCTANHHPAPSAKPDLSLSKTYKERKTR